MLAPRADMKVLIAEDNDEFRDSLVYFLGKFSVTTIPCRNGSEALEILLIESGISHLITDLEMPIMTGVELIMAIPESIRVNLHILLLSGNGPGLQEAERILGVQAIKKMCFAEKPLPPDDALKFLT